MTDGDRVPGQTSIAVARNVWQRLGPVRRRVRARATVDTRALAAFRIALAVTILVDLLHRSRHMTLFYTDQGIYPIAAYEATYTQFNGFSIHALSGDLWFQQFMFLVAGLFAVAMLVGYRSRLVTLISFLLLFSLHARNPAVLNGGDILFRTIVMLAVLPPIGERWSIDALRRGSARKSVASFGTAAILIQPVVVFTANAILKHRGETWYAGDAIEIALQNDVMRILLGNVIVDYPALMTALNYGWVTLLAGSTLFLLATVGRLRAVAALAYISAFFGMLLSMSVGLFPLVLTSSLLPFLTAPFWDRLATRVPARWHDRLPDRESLGPLGNPPIERRLVGRLQERGQLIVSVGRTLFTALCVLVFVWILVFAASDVTGRDVPDQIDHEFLDQQSWGLYAPNPSTAYSWYVTEATLENGTAVDAIDGGAVDFDRPPDGSEAYKTFRHRKFMRLVKNSGQGDTSPIIADRYGERACRQTNENYDGQADFIRLYRMVQQSPLDGSYQEPTRDTIIQHDCQTE